MVIRRRETWGSIQGQTKKVVGGVPRGEKGDDERRRRTEHGGSKEPGSECCDAQKAGRLLWPVGLTPGRSG